ncbi:hypothetical protein ACRAWF_02550 [Streptomyces sp. L7]
MTGELRPGGRGTSCRATRAAPSSAATRPTASSRPGSSAAKSSWIELRLTPEGDGTRFEVGAHRPCRRHEWAEFGPRCGGRRLGTRSSWGSTATCRAPVP